MVRIVGLDLARGADRTVVTTNFRHRLKLGERVNVGGAPNSVRHHVEQIVSDTAFEMSAYVRPSKGYRKHLRRMKAMS